MRLLIFLHMLLRHVVSIFALPVIVVIITPVLLVSFFPFEILWRFQFSAAISSLIVGLFLIGIGFVLLYSTITLFIKKRGRHHSSLESDKKTNNQRFPFACSQPNAFRCILNSNRRKRFVRLPSSNLMDFTVYCNQFSLCSIDRRAKAYRKIWR